MMSNERVRYGYDATSRKDVLYTVRHEGNIYFGISRCNVKIGDKFDKTLGVTIAAGRARTALADVDSLSSLTVVNLYLDQSGTRGYCKIEDVKSLLNYFDNLNNRK